MLKRDIKSIAVAVVLYYFLPLPAVASNANYESADGHNGGLLYDHFWKQGAISAKFSNTYQVDLAPLNKFPDFYRCKSCHGWDMLGSKGYYIKKSPQAGKHPNVTTINLVESVAALAPEEIFSRIKHPPKVRPETYDPSLYDPSKGSETGDRMPNYGRILSDREIWDLVKFLKENAVDHRDYYTLITEGSYPGGKARFEDIGKGGNPAHGREIYGAHCASCHGTNGTEISIKGLSVGAFAREKTYELAHKVKFGQPGSNMYGTWLGKQDMKDLHKALVDKNHFPDMPK